MALALKEWAVHVLALANGEQTVILRKGGIQEETAAFRLESSRFYLYPTYEHQKQAFIREPFWPLLEQTWQERTEQVALVDAPETVAVHSFAEVIGERLIHDETELLEVARLHIGTPLFAIERLHWKRQQPLHALSLQVYRLPQPLLVQVKPEYGGCKSWIDVSDLPPLTEVAGKGEPVLSKVM